jgi:hypothetical protein
MSGLDWCSWLYKHFFTVVTRSFRHLAHDIFTRQHSPCSRDDSIHIDISACCRVIARHVRQPSPVGYKQHMYTSVFPSNSHTYLTATHHTCSYTFRRSSPRRPVSARSQITCQVHNFQRGFLFPLSSSDVNNPQCQLHTSYSLRSCLWTFT